MKKINLRDLFPFCGMDCFIEVPDADAKTFTEQITEAEAAVFIEFERAKAAYLRDLFRNKAHYSLNQGDGIEHEAIFQMPSPEDIYERDLSLAQLHAAIASLPEKQARRIYAHYILGMSKTAIAIAEGVHKMTISDSISHGLRNLKKSLETFF